MQGCHTDQATLMFSETQIQTRVSIKSFDVTGCIVVCGHDWGSTVIRDSKATSNKGGNQ